MLRTGLVLAGRSSFSGDGGFEKVAGRSSFSGDGGYTGVVGLKALSGDDGVCFSGDAGRRDLRMLEYISDGSVSVDPK